MGSAFRKSTEAMGPWHLYLPVLLFLIFKNRFPHVSVNQGLIMLFFYYFAVVGLRLMDMEGQVRAPQVILDSAAVHFPTVDPPITTANYLIFYDSINVPVYMAYKRRVVIVRKEFYRPLAAHHLIMATCRKRDWTSFDNEVQLALNSHGLLDAEDYWEAEYPELTMKKLPKLAEELEKRAQSNHLQTVAKGFADGSYGLKDEFMDSYRRMSGEQKESLLKVILKQRKDKEE